MNAIVIPRPGGPDVLTVAKRPRPSPGPGDILVRVHASALNRADILQRRGKYPAPPGAPEDIPGLEYAGEVTEMGPGAGLWAVGNRVMGIVAGGGHAEYVCVNEREAIRIPQALSFEEAAAVPEAFMTAYDALFRILGITVGDRVLIHAVASGVGTAASSSPQRRAPRCSAPHAPQPNWIGSASWEWRTPSTARGTTSRG
jgi:NADPH:quinone reductase